MQRLFFSKSFPGEASDRVLGMVKDWKAHQEKHWFDGKAKFWFAFMLQNSGNENHTKFAHPISPKCQGKKTHQSLLLIELKWRGLGGKKAVRHAELDESDEPPRPGIVHEESLAESRASAKNGQGDQWDPVNGERESGKMMVILFERGPNSFFSICVATAVSSQAAGPSLLSQR